MVELDSQIEMNPSLWGEEGIVWSVRSVVFAMIPIALSIMAILLVRPHSVIIQLAVASVIAYLNAEFSG